MYKVPHPNAHGQLVLRSESLLRRVVRPVGCITAALICLTCAATSFADPAPREHVNPYPRHVNRIEKAHEWTFKDGPAGWRAVHDCRIGATDGRLTITATGPDPYLFSPVHVPGGAMLIKLRAKCSTAGHGQLFWTTQARPNPNEASSRRFNLNHDGQWHDYDVPVAIDGRLTGLRFDPARAGRGRGRADRAVSKAPAPP